MIMLFWFVFFGVIVVTLFALSLFEKSNKKDKGAKDIELGIKEKRVLELELELAPFKKDLERSKSEHINLKKEIEEAKKREADLKAELARKDQWAARSVEELNKIKAQNTEPNNKFANKEKELQNEIESLKHQNESYVMQIQANAVIIADLKRKQEGTEGVSKNDFNKLNEEHARLEKELGQKEEKIKTLEQELIRLKNEEIARSKKEFNIKEQQDKQQTKPDAIDKKPVQALPQPAKEEQKQPEQLPPTTPKENQTKEEPPAQQPSKEEPKEPPAAYFL
jgi:chromosome segregation ATPase